MFVYRQNGMAGKGGMFKKIIVFLILPLFASCIDVVRVREASDANGKTSYNDIGGVPFYTKVAQFTQKTVYDVTWLKVTLSIEKQLIPKPGASQSADKIPAQTFEKNICIADQEKLNEIKEYIVEAQNENKDMSSEILKAFEALPKRSFADHKQYIESCKMPPISQNIVERTLIANTDHPYYLNAPLPWFGNGSLTQKLGEDGTLTEATASADTKLAEGISQLIPLKEYLTGRFVKSASSDSDAKVAVAMLDHAQQPDNVNVVFSIKAEQVGYEYTFTKILSSSEVKDGNLIVQKAIDFSPETYSFSRKKINSESGDEKKDDGQKIGISGSIEFPKDWNASSEQKK